MPDSDTETPAETSETAAAEPVRGGERTAGFKLAVFGAVLIVVLFAGYGIGRLNEAGETRAGETRAGQNSAGGEHQAAAVPRTGAAVPPAGAAVPPAGDGHAHDAAGTAPHTHNADGSGTSAGGADGSASGVGGLALTSAGLTIVSTTPTVQSGRRQTFGFAIEAAGGAKVTTFAVVHDKPLHLIVVRRDLTGFQHLHPTMAPDGTWNVPLTLSAPGAYRAIADFTAIVGGQQVPATLGVDLTAPGDYRPVTLPAPAQQAVAGDFQVAYEGQPRIGSSQPLYMTVTTEGRPAGLEPYLGAYGHLVVMREGDLGYVHVHPEPVLVDGKVRFWLAAPGPGRYRMFFDFQVAGQVHTAAWTAVVS